MMNEETADRLIRQNIIKHERISTEYDEIHVEILNDVEQKRLGLLYRELRSRVTSACPTALDFGCGTGNLTRHLIDNGFRVIVADITPSFTELTSQRFGDSVRPLILNGSDIQEIESNSLDLSSTYSVLHHVPDYLSIVKELIRIVKSEGFIVIDHEASSEHYHPSPALAEFRSLTKIKHSPLWYLQQLLSPRWWVRKIRKTLNPRYAPEGDIHVWPDDHIEWDKIRAIFDELDVEIIRDEDYLLYYPHYDLKLYEEYKNRCSDVHLLIGRKRA